MEIGFDQRELAILQRQDPLCCALFAEYEQAEQAYCRVINALSETDRKIVDKYIYLGEELDYQKMRLAYRMGIMQGTRP